MSIPYQLNLLKMKENEPVNDIAIFASGCFWGTEHYLSQLDGVVSTSVGYTGGTKDNPTYEEVSSGDTGHVEAVEVIYDPARISYEILARAFFESHDPTQVGGQGPDIGDQYRSVIFYNDEEQKNIAQKLISELEAKGMEIATEIRPVQRFWKAEDYHQKYYLKTGGNPYCHFYRKLF